MCPRATCCLRATGWAGQETRLRVGRSGVRITVGTRDICLLQNIQTPNGPTQLLFNVYWGYFPEGKVAAAWL